MKKAAKDKVFRALTYVVSVVLLVGQVMPPLAYAQTAEERIQDRLTDAVETFTDTTPPTIAAHADVSAEATAETGANVTYEYPATSDNVDAAGIASCSPPSGSRFPVGATTVTCTASDSTGNAATPTTFSITVSAMPQESTPPDTATSTPTDSTGSPQAATSTPTTTPGSDTATSTPDTGNATTTPETSNATSSPDTTGSEGGTATTTPQASGSGAGGGSGSATSTPTTSGYVDPATASSTAAAVSASVPENQSDTDNTDFQNIVSGDLAPPCDANTPGCLIDASATSTEALATTPQFLVATSTNGTGSKIGGSIFTGGAIASTTVSNVLNITRSSVDGPGKTNSSMITAKTDNIGTLTTTDETLAYTGENRGLGGEGDATIYTGTAVSSARVLNVVNTNFFNSSGLVLFLNPQNGDSLDLRAFDLSYFQHGGVGASPTQLGCTVLTCLNSANLSVLNKNVAEVNSEVEVRASTGENVATSTKNGGTDIRTGNAYASAAVLNLVNTNFVNAKYLVASFDNFGDMQGDIVLPDPVFFDKFFQNGNTLPEMNSSSFIVQNDNEETFMGTTTAHAITGQNVATSTGLGHGDIVTGQAHTSSTSFTAANQTHVGGSSALFVFHVSGDWNGTVKGLPAGMSWRRTAYGIEVYSNGSVTPQGTQGIYNSSDFIASSTNKATVKTDVNVWAETGSNAAEVEDGTAGIRTGDAYATANVVNMVNTNVVNRNFIFAVFNIAGDWQGDIDFGGHSPNLQVTTTVEQPTPTVSGSELTYHFLVRNDGDVPATGVVLSTTYNKSLLVFSRGNAVSTDTTLGTNWAIGTLAPGASYQVDASARVFATGLQAGFSMLLPLVATVSETERDQDISDNSQRTTITVASPDASPDSGTGSTDGGTGATRDRGGGSSGTDTGSTGSGSGSPPASGGGGPPAGTSNTGTGSSDGSSSPGSGNAAPSGDTSGSEANGNSTASSGGGGGSGGGGNGASNDPNATLGRASVAYWTSLPASAVVPSPSITSTKSASIGTTTVPAKVDYKVVVKNQKSAGPLYGGMLTDTLYDPWGKVVYTRSWNLDMVVPGDEIRLSYTVAFASTTKPGIYHNVARVTGTEINTSPIFGGRSITPVNATGTIVVISNGQVLGDSTSTVAELTSSDLQVTRAACEPLLTTNLRPGSSNAAEVMKLQSFLAQDTSVYPQGLVTGYFGSLTTAAVKAFQRKYADDILAPVGLSYATGLVYSSTIRKVNSLACGGVDPVVRVDSGSDVASVPDARAPATPSKPKAPAKAKPTASESQQDSALLNAIGSLFSKFRW